MKYTPSEESEEINYVAEKNPWFNVVILVSAAIAMYLIFVLTLGFGGELIATTIPPQLERKLFSFIDLKVNQKPWPLGQQIVDDIFKRNDLSDNYSDNYTPTVFISCLDTINAVALPGRKIIVFNGLLKEIKTLNSLYFIIGHEVGHILNRDHIRSLGRSLAMSLGFSLIIGTDSSALFSFQQALIERQFSQHQESDSDQKAIEFTLKRFNGLYNSHEFFDHIMKQEPNATKTASFLNTHPTTQGRIDRIKNHPSYNPATTLQEALDPKLINCTN